MSIYSNRICSLPKVHRGMVHSARAPGPAQTTSTCRTRAVEMPPADNVNPSTIPSIYRLTCVDARPSASRVAAVRRREKRGIVQPTSVDVGLREANRVHGTLRIASPPRLAPTGVVVAFPCEKLNVAIWIPDSQFSRSLLQARPSCACMLLPSADEHAAEQLQVHLPKRQLTVGSLPDRARFGLSRTYREVEVYLL